MSEFKKCKTKLQNKLKTATYEKKSILEIISEWQRLITEISKQFKHTKEIWEHADNSWLWGANIIIIHALYGILFPKKIFQKWVSLSERGLN